MVTLTIGNQKVKIDAGELVSYSVEGHEYIHQKGNPGWRNADTEMFPIIGPTSEANFRVHTPKGNAVQDQHGLLRELPYVLEDSSEERAVFQKKYKADSKVENSKFPKKSTEKELFWPYNFQFEKRFELKDDHLEITFKISGDEGMPFMLGYHPAFLLQTENPIISANNQVVTLEEILAVGSRALYVPDCSEITLKDEKGLAIKTEGFGQFMLWTEVTNMVCIEPISFYPYAVEQDQLDKGFEHLKAIPREFRVYLIPNG